MVALMLALAIKYWFIVVPVLVGVPLLAYVIDVNSK